MCPLVCSTGAALRTSESNATASPEPEEVVPLPGAIAAKGCACARTHTLRTTVLQVDKRAHSACGGSEQRAKGATADNLESHTSRGDANGGTVAQTPTSKPSPLRVITNVATPDNNSNNEGAGGRSPSLYEVCPRSLLGGPHLSRLTLQAVQQKLAAVSTVLGTKVGHMSVYS